MRQIISRAGIVLFSVILLITAVLLLNPSARRLAPTWLYYDLAGRRIAPAPPDVEQFIVQSGQDYCSIGRDSDCGGYKIVGISGIAVDQAAQQRDIAAAWCVDYVVLRRNQGRLTGGWIYWANIPKAMVVLRMGDGHYDSLAVEDCRTAVLE